MDTYICMAESLCCLPEAITTLSITILQYKIIFKNNNKIKMFSLFFVCFFMYYLCEKCYKPFTKIPNTRWCCCVSYSVVSNSLKPSGAHQAPLSVGFPCKSTEVGYHSLIQGILLAQGSKLGLLSHRWNSLPSEPRGQPYDSTVNLL